MFQKIAVIIPTYNERENITGIIQTTADVFKENDFSGYVFISDANSADKTGIIADKLATKFHGNFQVKVFHEKKKLGLGKAYVNAFDRCLKDGADVVIQMDADFSHDPKSIKSLVQALSEGADLAVGSRYVKGGRVENWGFIRRLISKGGSLYSRIILGVPINDWTGGFNAYKSEMLKKLDPNSLKSNGYSFQIEHKYKTYKLGGIVQEVPIIFKDRTHGASKMSKKIFLEAIKNVWLLRFGKL